MPAVGECSQGELLRSAIHCRWRCFAYRRVELGGFGKVEHLFQSLGMLVANSEMEDTPVVQVEVSIACGYSQKAFFD